MITRSCRTRVPTAGIKGKRGRKRRRESCPRIQYPRETCPDFIEKRRERNESRREKARRGRAISRATMVPQALISSIISFGDAADRWWVRENERESISGNQPPRAAFCCSQEGRRERKCRETLRSNNPVCVGHPCPSSPSSPSLPSHCSLPFFEREKIKNLNC